MSARCDPQASGPTPPSRPAPAWRTGPLALAWLFAALAGGAASTAGVQVRAPASPVYREIGDWILACDNVHSCVAKLVPNDDASDFATSSAGAGLKISRDAGPAGRLMLEIWAEQAFDPAAMRLDGRPATAAAGWRSRDGGKSASLQGEAALSFVRAIRNGRVLVLSDAPAGPAASLRGLAAVLLGMDEDQGRIGDISALARPGPAKAAASPAAPGLPTLVAAPPAKALANGPQLAAAVRRLQGAILKRHDCDPGAADEDEAQALNAAEALVLLECRAGAYQASSLAFRLPRDRPERAKLLVLSPPPTVSATGADVPPGEYIEPSFDPKSATFGESAKGRGLADCGFSNDWIFDGRDFHLARALRQERCGGEPGDWPVIYRTALAPGR